VIVAIASGKGGTGKTTFAVNLARSLEQPSQLLDCDVEAPNAHLYLRPRILGSEAAGILVPRLDAACCTLCGDCAELCRYNALAVLRTGVMVFPELCHGCGGCALVCPEGAITEELRPIGVVEWGVAGDVELVSGRLDIGEAQAPPLIRAVKAKARGDRLVVVDAPPGTSCPTIAAIQGSDLVLLVTEPTPFGLNDLALAVETVRALGLPFAVAVNRAGSGDGRVHEFCAAQDIAVLAELPDDRRIAEASARGRILVDELEHVRPVFGALARRLVELSDRSSPTFAAVGGAGAEGRR
jgi:MinD superfamily P-loop ATPase